MLEQVIDDTTVTGRLELKYVVERVDSSLIYRWMKNNAFTISKRYRNRNIFNFYFDTPDLDCYEENLAGISKRSKFRIRWDGQVGLLKNGKIEIKRKSGGVGFKDRFSIDEIFHLKEISHRKFRERMYTLIKKENSVFRENFARNLVPILINSYEREYYQVESTPVRITIDRNQRVYSQLHRRTINVNKPVKIDNRVIVEIKCPPSSVFWIKKAIEGLPILRSRNSKYVQGVQVLI